MIPKELFDYLERSKDAIFAAKGGKTEYFNIVAKRLFPNWRSFPAPQELVPGLPEPSGEGTAAVLLRNVPYEVRITAAGGYTVYTVCAAETMKSIEKRLLSNIEFSLRNSMSVFKASGELLRQMLPELPEKMERYAAAMSHSASQLQRNIANLNIMFAGLDGMAYNESSFDLVSVCGSLIDTVSILTREKNISLSFRTAEESLLFAGDREQIERMLLNLLSNSFKATPAGGSISLSLSAKNGTAYLTVADTGCGIPEAVKGNVFRRYESERSFSNTEDGIGAGLHAVVSIAQRHGGAVVLESREGSGTTVTASLAIKKTGEDEMRSPAAEYGAPGMAAILEGLSDVLGLESYKKIYFD